METVRDRIELEGTVISSNKGKFEVQTDSHVVLCTLSGKIRTKSIRILLGDRVTVEVSPYGMDCGRIVYRHKQ